MALVVAAAQALLDQTEQLQLAVMAVLAQQIQYLALP
jgi:hypothetical protein